MPSLSPYERHEGGKGKNRPLIVTGAWRRKAAIQINYTFKGFVQQ